MTLAEFRRVYPTAAFTVSSGKLFTYRYYDLSALSRSAGAPRPCCKSAGRDPYQTGERQNRAVKQVWQPVGEDTQAG